MKRSIITSYCNYLISHFSWKIMNWLGIFNMQELLRREAGRSHGGVPFMYVVLVGILGILLGFLLKRTWPEWLPSSPKWSIVESNKKYVRCAKTNLLSYCRVLLLQIWNVWSKIGTSISHSNHRQWTNLYHGKCIVIWCGTCD